jgi:hypothetical protein
MGVLEAIARRVLLTAASDAGLAAAHDREWAVTTAGEQWLQAPTPQRWEMIAEGFRRGLPRGLRTASGGFAAPEAWATMYPLDAEWPARAARRHQRTLARLHGRAEGRAQVGGDVGEAFRVRA